ncbi:hypothetical protein MTR67_011908 [Solanum verrucosum]|uniref:Uncharacterized protein n=1 Tax=Solanum verrucosum TaxID=315347 RepID=A0AAF0Q8X4_SOLVR|nr:hypothetical protein MTR67_011908 [Solanum verrucosum]
MCSSVSLGFGQGQNVRIRCPRATLRGLEEDPNLSQASCQGSLQIALGRNRDTSRSCSPKEQKVSSQRGRVTDSTVSKFNSKYLRGTAQVRDENAEIQKSIFTSLKGPTK